MTAYERMKTALSGKVSAEIPVTPHWWGLYRFQLAGMINGYEDENLAWNTPAQQLAEIDCGFYESFLPDMFHLTTAPSKTPYSSEQQTEILALRKQAAKLESYTDIDRYMKMISQTTEQVVQSGVFDHVKLHRKRYGEKVLLALNEGADIACYFDTHVGFENACIGFVENPEMTQYFLSCLYKNTLNRIRALKECGIDAYINSETYCSSDVLSPEHYRKIILPIQQNFYRNLKEIGIIPIGYFTGDIRPILEDIKTLDLCGIMVEESKKGFTLEPSELVHCIERQFALFGNLDSYCILQTGTPEQVAAETKRQLEGTRGYPFIMSNGCPISFYTPEKNIHTMIQTTRDFE